jgi:hypothetical protein
MLPAYGSELEPTGILEDWDRVVEPCFAFSAVDAGMNILGMISTNDVNIDL